MEYNLQCQLGHGGQWEQRQGWWWKVWVHHEIFHGILLHACTKIVVGLPSGFRARGHNLWGKKHCEPSQTSERETNLVLHKYNIALDRPTPRAKANQYLRSQWFCSTQESMHEKHKVGEGEKENLAQSHHQQFYIYADCAWCLFVLDPSQKCQQICFTNGRYALCQHALCALPIKTQLMCWFQHNQHICKFPDDVDSLLVPEFTSVSPCTDVVALHGFAQLCATLPSDGPLLYTFLYMTTFSLLFFPLFPLLHFIENPVLLMFPCMLSPIPHMLIVNTAPWPIPLAPALEVTGGCGGYMFGGPILVYMSHINKKSYCVFLKISLSFCNGLESLEWRMEAWFFSDYSGTLCRTLMKWTQMWGALKWKACEPENKSKCVWFI